MKKKQVPDIVDINVSSPWFEYIRSGIKRVEGRLNKGKFAAMQPGTVLRIQGSPGEAPVIAVVLGVCDYSNFELKNTLPGINTISRGVAVYREFYDKKSEKAHGVRSIHLHVLG